MCVCVCANLNANVLFEIAFADREYYIALFTNLISIPFVTVVIMYLENNTNPFLSNPNKAATPTTGDATSPNGIPLHPQFPADQQPVYNGVNPNHPGVRMIHHNPPMFAVDDFLTPEECQFLISAGNDSWTPAPVVGKGSGEISQARTSSTCYLAREDVPNLMRKVSNLTGKPIEHCELPQVGRYLASQQYYQVRLV